MSQKWPQKFRKSIFEVKKSNFNFISTNHSRMDCNLPNTLKSNFFALLRPLHWGKAAFTDFIMLQMTQKWPQKFRKSIFEVKKSNFHFISTNHFGMDCNLSNTFTNIIFAFFEALTLGPSRLYILHKPANDSKMTSKISKIDFLRSKNKICILSQHMLLECVATCWSGCKVLFAFFFHFCNSMVKLP